MADKVLVSGGSGGIGGALCRQFADAGYLPVVGYARNRDAAETLAHEIGGTALPLDLTDVASISDATDSLAEIDGDLAGVVLAASPPPAIGPFFRLPEDELDLQWAVNVKGAAQLLDGCVRKLMRPQRAGWVMAILSAAMGNDGPAAKSMGGYIVAKYGLLGLMKVIEAEYGWLDVYTIDPDYTETDMLQVFDDRFLDQMRAQRAGGRFASPADVARDAIALISKAM